MQNEITEKDKLLDDRGLLKHKGYSRFPVLEYNPENIKIYPLSFLNRLRLKEWDYYGLTTSDFYFSATVANIGYAGLAFVYFIDFHEKAMTEETILVPFGKGCYLPRSSETGDIYFRHAKAELLFERKRESRAINVNWPGFAGGKGMAAMFEARQPADLESIIVATPIGKNRFYYNQKINCMPVEGMIVLDDRKLDLVPEKALANLDWGRGVWEYSSFWVWASASGFLPSGSTVGLNMGKGFGDLSHATENCFFVDGKMTKLEWVKIEYDSTDFMKPWTFVSKDGRLDLVFEPFFDRVASTNMLIITSGVHQLFGKYSGTLVTDSGEKIQVQDVIGWAEEHEAKW